MYDIIIIGAGPAGLTAAIYGARYNLNVLVIGETLGGLMMEAHSICNYPGFLDITGMDLTNNLKEQVDNLKVELKNETVAKIEKSENGFAVTTKEGNYEAKKILLALGTKKRKLNIPQEEKLLGRGISYCYTCDGFFFKEKIIGVVGGSDAAATAALYLADIGKKVYIIYRKDKLRAEPAWVKKIEENPKIEVVYKANVVEAKGEERLESVVLDNGKELKLDGLFVEIGSVPSNVLAMQLGVKKNDKDSIIVDEKQETNVKGVYAAGDITTGSNGFRQIITAASEGAIAVEAIFSELR
ncbi:FAD-dependent oxidoreductase [Candidatus Woesearchaeota archaeon]|nr:FAD-dependent oxidoreductase [Candidatus Woesearchaeota archaeon]